MLLRDGIAEKSLILCMACRR